MQLFKKLFSLFVAFATVGSLIGFAAPAHAATSISQGDLIKGSMSTVYYYAADGNRYNFPNEKTYFTWYSNFNSVKTITDTTLASVPLVGNVTYRPGTRMVKIQSDPKVYAVQRGGELRWVTTESVASGIYGSNWNQYIDDISVAFFPYYNIGEQIDNADDYAKDAQYLFTTDIDIDKGLTAGPYGAPSAPTLTDPGNSVTSGTTFNITWSSVTNGIRYYIERDTSSSFTSPTKVYSGSSTSTTDYLVPSTTTNYYYRVKAINPAGESSWSSTQDITISTSGVPSAPTLNDPGLLVNSGDSYNISFSSVSGATTYVLQESTDVNFATYTQIYSGNLTSYTQSHTVSSDTIYYYRAQARNAVGHSAWSNMEDITVRSGSTTPSTPTITMVNNVPDPSHPANNPLGLATVEQFSHPLAGAAIIDYWETNGDMLKALHVNGDLSAEDAAGYIGWFMRSNDEGSADRSSAVTFGTSLANAYLGLVDWVVWDGDINTSYGFDDPAVVLANKTSYTSWDFDPIESNTTSSATAWNNLMSEIDAGRPVWMSFSYWNPEDTGYDYSSVYFYDWGTSITSSTSATNEDTDAQERWSTNSDWTKSVGHGVVAVGYVENFDAGSGAQNWVIVHDTWDTTPENIAIPFDNWIASTHITPQTNDVPDTPEMYDPGDWALAGTPYTVTWSKEQGTTSYCYEYADNADFIGSIGICTGDGSKSSMNGVTVTTLLDTYYYHVQACNASGCSGYSNTVDMTVSLNNLLDVSDYAGDVNAALAAAAPGDTVYAEGGSYVTGTVVVPDFVSLIGAGPDTTTINANNDAIGVMLGNGTLLQGFKIINAGIDAISCLGITSTTIKNNVIIASDIGGIAPNGILVGSSYDVNVINNTIIDETAATVLPTSGIYTDASSMNYFYAENNLIDGFAQSFYVVNGAGITDYNAAFSPLGTEWVGMAAMGANDIVGQATYGSNYSDVTLEPGSLGIDMGNPAASYLDIDGTINDMGAYGGPDASTM